MTSQHDALKRRASTRASVRNHLRCTGHFLEFRPKESDLLAVVFVVGLRNHFITSNLQNQIANFSVNLMSSCMVRMMIVS